MDHDPVGCNPAPGPSDVEFPDAIRRRGEERF